MNQDDLAKVGEVGVWGSVQCEPQEEVEDGWCNWVCPKPRGYLMQCCDCELIHEVDFRVVRYESEDSEVYEVVDDPDLQAQMRLRRRDDISPKKPHQKPVAWRYALDASVEGPRWIYIDKDPHQWLQGPAMVNAAIEELHTSPQPSKPWVGLTDDEVAIICGECAASAHKTDDISYARAIEAKLKEKNT